MDSATGTVVSLSLMASALCAGALAITLIGAANKYKGYEMATMRVVMKQRVLGQEVRNVFYVAGADAVLANAQDIVDHFKACWVSGLALSTLSSSWTLYGASVKEVDEPTNPTVEFGLTGGAVVGTAGTEVLPTQIAALITFKSLTARPNRSPKYLAGFVEAAVTGGLITSTFLTAMAAFGDKVLSIDSDTGLAIAPTVTRIDKVTGELVGSNILTSYVTQSVPATQRRRRIGQGI